jgi:hypothetical protein
MIRQIVRPEGKKLILDIPNEFVGRRVEVIAFEIEEETVSEKKSLRKGKRGNTNEGHAHLMKFIQKHPITLPKGYKFNREDLYE